METCLVFSVLSALVDAADLLSCEDCRTPGETCEGNTRPCFLGEDTCGSILGKTSLGTERSSGILKTCTEYGACKAGIRTLTFGPRISLKRSALCCQGGDCRNQSVLLPPENTTQNGFACPTCYAELSDSCIAERTLLCTGPEDHCISVMGTLDSLQDITATSITFFAKGCATKSTCEPRQGLSVYAGNFSYTISTVKACHPAPGTTNSAHTHRGSRTKPLSLALVAVSVTFSIFFLCRASFP